MVAGFELLFVLFFSRGRGDVRCNVVSGGGEVGPRRCGEWFICMNPSTGAADAACQHVRERMRLVCELRPKRTPSPSLAYNPFSLGGLGGRKANHFRGLSRCEGYYINDKIK